VPQSEGIPRRWLSSVPLGIWSQQQMDLLEAGELTAFVPASRRDELMQRLSNTTKQLEDRWTVEPS
jgi:hypothetical protein